MALVETLKEHMPEKLNYWNDSTAAEPKSYHEEDRNKSGPKRKLPIEEELLMTFMWMRSVTIL